MKNLYGLLSFCLVVHAAERQESIEAARSEPLKHIEFEKLESLLQADQIAYHEIGRDHKPVTLATDPLNKILLKIPSCAEFEWAITNLVMLHRTSKAFRTFYTQQPLVREVLSGCTSLGDLSPAHKEYLLNFFTRLVSSSDRSELQRYLLWYLTHPQKGSSLSILAHLLPIAVQLQWDQLIRICFPLVKNGDVFFEQLSARSWSELDLKLALYAYLKQVCSKADVSTDSLMLASASDLQKIDPRVFASAQRVDRVKMSNFLAYPIAEIDEPLRLYLAMEYSVDYKYFYWMLMGITQLTDQGRAFLKAAYTADLSPCVFPSAETTGKEWSTFLKENALDRSLWLAFRTKNSYFVNRVLPLLSRAMGISEIGALLQAGGFRWPFTEQLADAAHFYVSEAKKAGDMQDSEAQNLIITITSLNDFFKTIANEAQVLALPLSGLLEGSVSGSETDFVRAAMNDLKDDLPLFYHLCIPSLRDPLTKAEQELLRSAFIGDEHDMLARLDVAPFLAGVPYTNRMIKSLRGDKVIARRSIDCAFWIAYKKGYVQLVRKGLMALENEIEAAEMKIVHAYEWDVAKALLEAAVSARDAETLRLILKSKRVVGRECLSPFTLAVKLQALNSANGKVRECVAQDFFDRRVTNGNNSESTAQRSLLWNYLTQNDYTFLSRIASWGSSVSLETYNGLELFYVFDRLASSGRIDILRACLAKWKKLSQLSRQRLLAQAYSHRHKAVAQLLAKTAVQ